MLHVADVSVEGWAKMRVFGPVRVAAWVWARLLAGVRCLAFWPAAWRRRGHLCFRVVWIGPYITPAQASQMYDYLSVTFTTQNLSWITSSPAAIAQLLGFWTPVASGYVGNVPSGTVVTEGSGDCLDAYGSNENNELAWPPAVPGLIPITPRTKSLTLSRSSPSLPPRRKVKRSRSARRASGP